MSLVMNMAMADDRGDANRGTVTVEYSELTRLRAIEEAAAWWLECDLLCDELADTPINWPGWLEASETCAKARAELERLVGGGDEENR